MQGLQTLQDAPEPEDDEYVEETSKEPHPENDEFGKSYVDWINGGCLFMTKEQRIIRTCNRILSTLKEWRANFSDQDQEKLTAINTMIRDLEKTISETNGGVE